MVQGADSGAGVEGVGGGVGADSNGEFPRCFGRQTKLLREAAGLTQAQLGERVGYGEAQIASVEQGRRVPRPELVDAVDREVGAGGAGGHEGGGGEGSVSVVLPRVRGLGG